MNKFHQVYGLLYRSYGSQNWWPAETPFEVMIGAILTQNTAWTNVEKALQNLKKENLLTPQKMLVSTNSKLAKTIRPSGYFNQKSKKLKNFLLFFKNKYHFSISSMRKKDLHFLRRELLEVNGIGPETADSILLYALEKSIFVIDAYTKRIFSRLGLCQPDISYDALQSLFMKNIKTSIPLFNEYHALIVHHGKNICKKTKPLCDQCCLRASCLYPLL